MSSTSLRDQHAELTRERILGAVADLLELEEPGELTMPEVARASGISLRTVYRYYATRDQLLEAAGRWIGDELLHHPYPSDLDEVSDLFEVGARDFDQRPGLVRALAFSQLGRHVRGYRRRERLEAIARALRAELPGLPEPDLTRAEAVLAYLHNMLAYTTMREENGL
ncbi:MAG TPA: TetR/AcrR family transcriptional regulator, partial [Solirubrobacteraceae bacterium]